MVETPSLVAEVDVLSVVKGKDVVVDSFIRVYVVDGESVTSNSVVLSPEDKATNMNNTRLENFILSGLKIWTPMMLRGQDVL